MLQRYDSGGTPGSAKPGNPRLVNLVSVFLEGGIEGTPDRPVAEIYDFVHTGWHLVNYRDSCACGVVSSVRDLRS